MCIEPLIMMAIWLIRGSREKRDRDAAQRFFKQAVAVVGHSPDQVTTDGHRSYPRAIHETIGSNGEHRTNKYLNNRLEQGHRGIRTTILSDVWRAETSRQQLALVVHVMRCVSSFAFGLL